MDKLVKHEIVIQIIHNNLLHGYLNKEHICC